MVPHHEVLQHVSSVLKDHGFSPTQKGIDVRDIYCCPYDCGKPDGDLNKRHGDMDAADTTMESPHLNVQAKKVPLKLCATIFQRLQDLALQKKKKKKRE
uniref:Uncharacterized protein n=1 Tax=Arundo donax TaxID=35708 RepID=A0A0A9G0B1_ARUDO